MVHYGMAAAVREQRQQVLSAAYAAHPERFVKGRPHPADLPQAVWINAPREEIDRSGCPRVDDRRRERLRVGLLAGDDPIMEIGATLME